ncbi:hypothetical protein A2U01_0113924, partial [Trifolium medium]|nr:hypothetical protein [Trifolium medium]
MMEEDPVIA